MLRNMDVREEINRRRVKFWEVAEVMEMSNSSFSKMLRKELTDAEKQRIYVAIDKIVNQ